MASAPSVPREVMRIAREVHRQELRPKRDGRWGVMIEGCGCSVLMGAAPSCDTVLIERWVGDKLVGEDVCYSHTLAEAVFECKRWLYGG